MIANQIVERSEIPQSGTAHWLRHQAKQMDTRAAEILHQYHQLPHTPK